MSRTLIVGPLLTGLVLAAVAPALHAVDASEVDTSRWQCRFCPDPEEGARGSVRAGVGYVSEDSFKHGEHTDLEEQGAYAIADAELAWQGEGTWRWDLRARDLGLDSRSIAVEGGRQGHYDFRFVRDERVHHQFGSGETPFLSGGGDDLRLPQGWVRAPSTTGMDALDSSLRQVDVHSDRRLTGIGASLRASERWSYDVDYRRELRDGRNATGVTFLITPVQLLEPIDHQTDTLDASMRYQAEGWHASLDYHGQLFRNDDRALTWDNPFTAVAPGADRGELALAPDNQAHHITLSGASKLGERLHASGRVATGYMFQDDGFLRLTSNAALTAPVLPRSSPEVEVRTLVASGRLRYRPPVAGLSVTLGYNAEVRDNDTPEDVFTQVVTDTFVGQEARNDPLSYARQSVTAKARYRLGAGRRIALGAEYERYERDYGADPDTDEFRVWGELHSRLAEFAHFEMKLEHAKRNGSGQAPVVVNGAPQNPLLTWFDIADRTANQGRIAVTLLPTARVELTVSAEGSLTEYDDTVIGRTERAKHGYGVEVSATPYDDVSLFAYARREIDGTDQRNSQSFGPPDWWGETDDAFHTIGLGGRIANIRDRLDLTLDLTYGNSAHEIDVEGGGGGLPFPDVDNERFTARLSAEYQAREKFNVRLDLGYETFSRRTWQLDGVRVGTLPDYLALGLESADHDVVVVAISTRYSL
jgi:MtrB/PioB family decaheme-associated outer membrane protein